MESFSVSIGRFLCPFQKFCGKETEEWFFDKTGESGNDWSSHFGALLLFGVRLLLLILLLLWSAAATFPALFLPVRVLGSKTGGTGPCLAGIGRSSQMPEKKLLELLVRLILQ
jgi:hypothetical protein